MKDFGDLFVNELKDIYNTEEQNLTVLLKMAMAASSVELKDEFTQQVKETEKQITRLDKIFKKLKINPSGSHSDAMDGLFKEADHICRSDYAPLVRDAALINCAQRIQHYQIALYGILKTFAKHLKQPEMQLAFDASLNEEKEADYRLTDIAEGWGLNEQALRRFVA